VQLPSRIDPLAEELGGGGKGGEEDAGDTAQAGYVHVRVQQRNGRKSLTTVRCLRVFVRVYPIITGRVMASGMETPIGPSGAQLLLSRQTMPYSHAR